MGEPPCHYFHHAVLTSSISTSKSVKEDEVSDFISESIHCYTIDQISRSGDKI